MHAVQHTFSSAHFSRHRLGGTTFRKAISGFQIPPLRLRVSSRSRQKKKTKKRRFSSFSFVGVGPRVSKLSRQSTIAFVFGAELNTSGFVRPTAGGYRSASEAVLRGWKALSSCLLGLLRVTKSGPNPDALRVASLASLSGTESSRECMMSPSCRCPLRVPNIPHRQTTPPPFTMFRNR